MKENQKLEMRNEKAESRQLAGPGNQKSEMRQREAEECSVIQFSVVQKGKDKRET
jgi:hypothetical protein